MSIYRHRVSVIVQHNQRILGFHAEDPYSGRMYFFIPGGKIEAGESPSDAAVRETLEETGYSIELISGVYTRSKYSFEWNGAVYETDTEFFLGRLIDDKATAVEDASYHRGVGWIPIEDVDEVFSYHPSILEAIKQLLARPSSK